ncbi:HDOD domain-containing protein [Zoogloea sp.]|jgi:HD-like signal output (HDOD) protein|uniref:HDOD domain-containing protein n=1 Tax=Zoogloea sp. TaxID=49181 RepID=UPI0035B10EB4
MSTPQELVACVEKLASLPAVYHRIRDLLDDPDSSMFELAEAVSSDTAITARVLRVVNSVLYGFPGKVETVSRAVNLMGMQQVHDLVLSTLVVAAFSGIRPARMHMGRFWSDSVLRGLAARAAARQLGMGDPERMFVEGLLADIGHLVMFQVAPEPSAAALEAAARDRVPVHQAEAEIVGCNFAEVGAALAAAWRLPGGFANAIGAQLLPALAGPHVMEAALLHLANQIVATRDAEQPDEAAMALLDPMSALMLEIDPARIAAVRAKAEEEHAVVITLFFPNQAGA